MAWSQEGVAEVGEVGGAGREGHLGQGRVGIHGHQVRQRGRGSVEPGRGEGGR